MDSPQVPDVAGGPGNDVVGIGAQVGHDRGPHCQRPCVGRSFVDERFVVTMSSMYNQPEILPLKTWTGHFFGDTRYDNNFCELFYGNT